MAELTIEMVAKVVKDEVGQLRNEISNAMTNNVAQVRSEMADGFTQVLGAIDALNDDQNDELEGIKGRLRHHSERIARLERHNNLR